MHTGGAGGRPGRVTVDRAALAADLARVGAEVVRRGLTWGTSGNLSARLGAGRFLISATGAALDDLTEQHLVDCAVASGGQAAGGRPSVEVEMHRAVYAGLPEAGAVLHASAPYTTLLACTRGRVPVHMNTDALAWVGRVVRVPYRPPGSRELAGEVAARAGGSRVLLLNNHGSLAWGATPDEVLTRTEALEFLAQLVVRARAARRRFAFLGPREQAHLRQMGEGASRPGSGLESGSPGKTFKR